MVMADANFGHTDPFTGELYEDADGWTDWDFLLVQADQLIRDWTDQNGLLAWEVNDHKQRVRVLAERRIDQFEAAKASITSGKRYKARPGEYFVPKLEKTTEDWPTHEEYFAHLAENQS